jgi:hypothetical protein
MGDFVCNMFGFIGLGGKWGEGWVYFPFLRLFGLRGGSYTTPETEVSFFASQMRAAVGVVADGYGDVAHGTPLDFGCFSPLCAGGW